VTAKRGQGQRTSFSWRGGQRVRSRLGQQNEGRDDVQLEVEREGDESDCSGDYKTRAGMTYYFLEVEGEGNTSDRGCDYTTREGTTYALEVKRDGEVSDRNCNYKMTVGTTYILEVEEGGDVRSQLRLQRGQRQRTDWRRRG
jgi:hypothetical protein